MELRHLRYFVAVGEEQHYGRGEKRLRVAQPALSRQIQDLEEEIGFKLFDRLSRGVKVSAAGKVFLEDARQVLQQVEEATRRAKRVASGQSGTLRVGFVESISWHGVVPDSLRQFRERQPDAELQLKPLRLFGANRGSPVLPTGCRIRVHDRQHRSRTGATRSRFDQFDAGSAQGISAHKI